MNYNCSLMFHQCITVKLKSSKNTDLQINEHCINTGNRISKKYQKVAYKTSTTRKNIDNGA